MRIKDLAYRLALLLLIVVVLVVLVCKGLVLYKLEKRE